MFHVKELGVVLGFVISNLFHAWRSGTTSHESPEREKPRTESAWRIAVTVYDRMAIKWATVISSGELYWFLMP